MNGDVASARVLLVDLDDISDFCGKFDLTRGIAVVAKRLEVAGYRVAAWSEWPSPSGLGLHVRIVLDKPVGSAVELVALQLIAGSDPMREAFNLTRVRNLDTLPEFWQERWNVLYTPQQERADG